MIDPARRQFTPIALGVAGLILASGSWPSCAGDRAEDQALRPLLHGVRTTEAAPHGEGNVYAPDVLIVGGKYRMWYGGQGRDGHDRIHLAESKDGVNWARRGVVLDNGQANHVNDPSVVKVGGSYFMFYTRAGAGVVDEIALATSKDGLAWEPKGVVLRPGRVGEWDSLLVGRPSVLHENGIFKMWYDGRKDLPPGAPAEGVPKSPKSSRSVGHAISPDGLRWTRHPGNPVLGGDAGGVDVERLGSVYVMAYETHEGTRPAPSSAPWPPAIRAGCCWSRRPGRGRGDLARTARLVASPLLVSDTHQHGQYRAAVLAEVGKAKLDEALGDLAGDLIG